MRQFKVKTSSRTELIDITAIITAIVKEEKMKSGLCHVFVPHTTAAITINENADPHVPEDILTSVAGLVPRNGCYRHEEGNSDAHVKASLFGSSETIIVEEERLVLGVWQSVFFCEFDGPRTRNVLVKLILTA
ncbi:MAG TPA: secondary thiamine-phosphate synthase enzyme YjbQ [Syntrophales bacterium]|nr:secondary thiamine-phosphate synthase enzyme YjbQ [Syntrophales bacterium]